MKKLFLLQLFALTAITVSACPMCSSPRAVQVRNYLFGTELPYNLFALLLPFVIFAALITYIYYFDLPFNNNKRI